LEDTSVSSIWTPSGEYRPSEEPEGSGIAPPGGGAPPGPDDDAPVTAEELEAMRRLHEQLRATPAVDIVANHVVQLFQLAVIYLGASGAPEGEDADADEPVADLVQAGIVIDTMAAIVDGLGPRLGGHEETLREALTQLQLLWVEIADKST
jgi:hypothetical protein